MNIGGCLNVNKIYIVANQEGLGLFLVFRLTRIIYQPFMRKNL